jgi:hypothetical protein
MKLYVWDNPYSVSYGRTIAYAVAESEEEARALVITAPVNRSGIGAEHVDHLDVKTLGPPDAVHELPYAEIYEWQE